MFTKTLRIKYGSRTDSVTAAMLLADLVQELTESWFKINGRFEVSLPGVYVEDRLSLMSIGR